MLQESHSRRDIDGVLQVVAAHQYGGMLLGGIIDEEFLEQYLARRVEEVERLIENDGLWTAEQG